MKLDFSTAVMGNLHKFCWFLLGTLYILLYAGHTPRVAMVKCVKTFLQPFSQKSVQLEDQLQRYNACFWRWKGEIEQNIYERKNKRKQKNALSDFLAAKDHVGRGGHCRQGDWDTFLIKKDELFCPRRAGGSWC